MTRLITFLCMYGKYETTADNRLAWLRTKIENKEKQLDLIKYNVVVRGAHRQNLVLLSLCETKPLSLVFSVESSISLVVYLSLPIKSNNCIKSTIIISAKAHLYRVGPRWAVRCLFSWASVGKSRPHSTHTFSWPFSCFNSWARSSLG